MMKIVSRLVELDAAPISVTLPRAFYHECCWVIRIKSGRSLDFATNFAMPDWKFFSLFLSLSLFLTHFLSLCTRHVVFIVGPLQTRLVRLCNRSSWLFAALDVIPVNPWYFYCMLNRIYAYRFLFYYFTTKSIIIHFIYFEILYTYLLFI